MTDVRPIASREEVLAVLKAHEADLRARGVARVALFGSLARGEARPDSDVDLMVEIDPAAGLDLWKYAGVVEFIRALFDSPVDVADRSTMFPDVRRLAEQDAPEPPRVTGKLRTTPC